MTDENPYRVTTEFTSVYPQDSEAGVRQLIVGWLVVFVLNLPVPVFLGANSVAGFGGYVGMAFGSLLWCGTGVLYCIRGWGQHVKATSLGGVFVALSQLYPVLHMFTGILAFAALSVMPGGAAVSQNSRMTTQSPGTDFLAATFLTLVSGGILIGVAWLIGQCLILLGRSFRPES